MQVGLTKSLQRLMPNSSIGNVLFWLTFCVVGQPMAILLYTIDYKYGKLVYDEHETMELVCKIGFAQKCLVR